MGGVAGRRAARLCVALPHRRTALPLALSLVRLSRSIDCPLSRLPPDLFVKHEGLAFAALAALQPAPRLRDIVARWARGQYSGTGSSPDAALPLG